MRPGTGYSLQTSEMTRWLIEKHSYPIKLGRQPLENMMDQIDLLMLAHVSVYIDIICIYIWAVINFMSIHPCIHTTTPYRVHTNVLRTPYICMYVCTSAVGKGKELELTYLHPSHALFHSQLKRGLYHRWTTVQYQARYPAKRRRPPEPATSKKTRPIGNDGDVMRMQNPVRTN